MSMDAWMRIGQPLEPVIDDWERVLDAWEDGGVNGLVFGRLGFADQAGQFTIPAFPARPEAYRKRGMEVVETDVTRDMDKEQRLHSMLESAKKRGWTVMIFCPGQGPVRLKAQLPATQDPYGALRTAAVWEEVFTAFPEADGGVVDGFTESAYELQYHHGNAVFAEIPDDVREQARIRGYDAERLDRGRDHLLKRFQNLTPSMVRYYGSSGVLAGMNLFDINQDVLYWLRWQRQDGIDQGRALRGEIDKLERSLLFGNGLRSAVFSGMTALDFHAWDAICDILLPKHYFWHRGFDGLYGTFARWVKQIRLWNKELGEADCFSVVKAFLGLELPQVDSLAAMESGFPQAFFDRLVQDETRRALAAVNDGRKIVPWVDTGRMPHGGDPMTAGDLQRILRASQEAGLQRFLFHNHSHLTSAEWCVISQMCGNEWGENPAGYWPPATPKPVSY